MGGIFVLLLFDSRSLKQKKGVSILMLQIFMSQVTFLKVENSFQNAENDMT